VEEKTFGCNESENITLTLEENREKKKERGNHYGKLRKNKDE
jgi:hypothetical protein